MAASKYLSFIDLLPAVVWFLIIFVAALIIRGIKQEHQNYRYYLSNLLVKIFFAIVYGIFYIFVYDGGDTTAYFDAAVTLNNLFFKSPELYIEQMLNAPTNFQFTTFYDSTTGFPPGWIFREQEAFFVSKIISLLSFFTLKSYFAMTIIFAAFAAHSSWKISQLVRSYKFSNDRLLIFGLLFLPSVNFWCSGISKDSVVFTSSLYLIYNAFMIISNKNKSTILNYIVVLFASFLIYHTRSFVLFAIAVPLFFSISARLIRTFNGGKVAVIVSRTIIIAVGILVVMGNISSPSEENLLNSSSALQQASEIQKDFKQNETYGDKKYDLGDVEFSAVGILKVMPLAIITGIFRPFIWEALSPTLILNGLESLIFLYLTFVFLRRKVRLKWKFIRQHEFLIFCLIFVLIIGFITGLTSVLYGVLVRLRSPLLPFLCILLTIDFTSQMGSKTINPPTTSKDKGKI